MVGLFSFLWWCFRAAFVHVAVGFQYLFFVKWLHGLCLAVSLVHVYGFVIYDKLWVGHWVRTVVPFKDGFLILIFATGFSAWSTATLFNHTFGVGRALIEVLEDSKHDEPSWGDFFLMSKALLLSVVSILVFVLLQPFTHAWSVIMIVMFIMFGLFRFLNALGGFMLFMLGAYAFAMFIFVALLLFSPHTAKGFNDLISADWSAYLLAWGAMFAFWALTREKFWTTIGNLILKNPLAVKVSDKFCAIARKCVGEKIYSWR